MNVGRSADNKNPFKLLKNSSLAVLSSYLLPRDIKSLSESCTLFCAPKNQVLQTMLQTNKQALLLFVKNYHLLQDNQKKSLIRALKDIFLFSAPHKPSLDTDCLRRSAKILMTSSKILSNLNLHTKVKMAIVANDTESLEKFLRNAREMDDLKVIGLLQFAKKNKAHDEFTMILESFAKLKGLSISDYALQVLLFGIELNKANIIDDLLENGADLQYTNKDGNTLLHLAALHDNSKAIEILIRAGVDKEKLNFRCKTPLHLACNNNSCKAVSVLIQNNVHADSCDDEDKTPLHIAVQLGKEQSASLLLDYGANIESRDNKNNTPLHLACFSGNVNMVKLLCERGAKADVKNSEGFTPFHLACKRGYHRPVQFLLEKFDDIGATDNQNQTPLHLASKYGHIMVVRTLLKEGAQIDDIDDFGNAPLHLASENDHYEVCKFLIKAEANVNSSNSRGRTPLHLASLKGNDTIVELLLSNDAENELADFEGNTPLHLASCVRHSNAALLLIEDGVKLDVRNKENQTPLHLACNMRLFKIVQIFMEKNADVNAVNKENQTPLFLACNRSADDVALLLLKNDAKFDIACNDGNTPLHMACLRNRTIIIEELLKHGVTIDQKAQVQLEENASTFAINSFGYSALHQALDTFDFKKALELLDEDKIDLLQKDSKGRSAFFVIDMLCKRLDIPPSDVSFDAKDYARQRLCQLCDAKIDPVELIDKKIGLPCFLRQLSLQRVLEIESPQVGDVSQAGKIHSIAYGLMDCFRREEQVVGLLQKGGKFNTIKYSHEMFLLRQQGDADTKGVIVVHKKNPTTLKIDVLAVDPTCKRQKLGTLLLLFATKMAQRDSLQKIILTTSKEGAFLYHSYGFRVKSKYSKDEWAKLDTNKQQEELLRAREDGSILQVSLENERSCKTIKGALESSLILK